MNSASSTCDFCGSTLIPHWPGAAVVRCRGCSLLYRHPPPSAENLAGLYQTSWTDPDLHKDETGSTPTSLASYYALSLATSIGRKDLSGLRLLEFGAGKGEMLSAMSELGAETWAVEPFGLGHLERRGFRVYPNLNALPPNVKFDGAVALEVVEHLPRPWEEIGLLKDSLRPSGFLLMSTPNAAGLNARLYRSRWREAGKPGHLVFFTPRSLTTVLAGCGFQQISRLHWRVPYSHTRLSQCKDLMLQLLGIDGALRYIAFLET